MGEADERHQLPVRRQDSPFAGFSTGFLSASKPSKLRQVFDIMKYVSKDEFLTALIEQAHVEHDSIGDIVLVPKLGREKLIFGDANDIEAKFDNLKIFYRDGMPKLGWSRYKTLNLKYSQQVRGMLANPEVATKIKPIMRDTLTAELVTTDNKKQSIQN